MNKRLFLIFIVIILFFISCSKDETQSGSQADTIKEVIPDCLKGERWITHFKEDILPYWTSAEARGVPQGNFPTFRGMDGRVVESDKEGNDLTVRYPRMLARQVYVYSIGFLITGDVSLLHLARDGCNWLIQHAWDKAHGGWYAVLDKAGNPIPDKEKYAQDTAYVAMAFASYYFVTRDPEVEKYILLTRDLIFTSYWDDENKRVFDGLSFDLKKEFDQGDDKGWELVAQLDQINAFMMLSQPVLSDPLRREQFLNDMKTLADTMVKYFLEDGIFWGIHTNKGKFDTRHVDFGHTLKSYWMLLQLDKRLQDHPYGNLVKDNVHKWLELAYDKEHGTWGEKMLKDDTGKLIAQYGSLWWSYAELDQVAATLNFEGRKYSEILANTAKNWLEGFVDKKYKGTYFSIKSDGSKGWDWPADDVIKCFQWKNGFHSTEHALVMYIHGCVLEKKAVELFFAVPPVLSESFIARPYIFDGKETDRIVSEKITIEEKTLSKVKVKFENIY